MPVAVRFALVPPLVPVAVGALLMQTATFLVLCVAAAIQGGVTLGGFLPFLLAGAIAPGISNLFITVGIREAGSSRASIAFGMARLFAVTIAVVGFGERPGPAVLVGAFLVVAGGIALALEPERPRHVRSIGIAIALAGAALFALRDNLVRRLPLNTTSPGRPAGAAMLAASLVVTSLVVAVRRNRVVWQPTVVVRWLPARRVRRAFPTLRSSRRSTAARSPSSRRSSPPRGCSGRVLVDFPAALGAGGAAHRARRRAGRHRRRAHRGRPLRAWSHNLL